MIDKVLTNKLEIHIIDLLKIKKNQEKIVELSEDERMQRIAELRKKAIMDEKATYAKGVEDGKIVVAKNMLKEKMDVELISRITGLKEEEIKELM